MTPRIPLAPPFETYSIDGALNYFNYAGEPLKPHFRPDNPIPYGRFYINGRYIKSPLPRELELAQEHKEAQGDYDVREAWEARQKYGKLAKKSRNDAPPKDTVLAEKQALMREKAQEETRRSLTPRQTARAYFRAGWPIGRIAQGLEQPEWRIRQWCGGA